MITPRIIIHITDNPNTDNQFFLKESNDFTFVSPVIMFLISVVNLSTSDNDLNFWKANVPP